MNEDLRNHIRVLYGPERTIRARRPPASLLQQALSLLGLHSYEMRTVRSFIEATHPASIDENGDRLMIVDLGPDYDEAQALQFAALVLEDLALGSQDWRTKIE